MLRISSTEYRKGKKTNTKATWAVVTGKATAGAAFEFASKNSYGPRKFSPEGAISVLLRDNSGRLLPDTSYAGKAYSYLPLPEEVCRFVLCCVVFICLLSIQLMWCLSRKQDCAVMCMEYLKLNQVGVA